MPASGDNQVDWAVDASQSADWAAPDPANKAFETVADGPSGKPAENSSGWE